MSHHSVASGFAKKLKKFRRLNRALKAKGAICVKDHVAVRHYNNLVSRFRKLQKQLFSLQAQLKFAAAGATFALLAGAGPEATAQTNIGPFEESTRAYNPLHTPIAGILFAPTSIDFDKDGDYDIVVGDESGRVDLLKNEGTATHPKFTKIPIPYVDSYGTTHTQLNVGYGMASPAFADIDNDGDQDLIVGAHGSPDRIYYYQNDNGVYKDQTFEPWNPVSKSGNPFYGYYVGGNPAPYFIDFDNDGDLDAFIGHDKYGGRQLDYFKFDIAEAEPFIYEYNVPIGSNGASPSFGDIDKDGDPDLVVGTQYNDLKYFRNDSGSLLEQTGTWEWDVDSATPGAQTSGSPFYAISIGQNTAPLLVDLDADGDLDMVVGYGDYYSYPQYGYVEATLQSFINEGKGVFTKQEGLENPFDGIQTGSYQTPAPTLLRVNDDLYLDLVYGPTEEFYNEALEQYQYRLMYYQGTADGSFIKVDDDANPFFGPDLYGDTFLITDFDHDANHDLEIIAGNYDRLYYFKKENGMYVRQADDESNPFSDIYFDEYTSFPNIVDIDGDSDLDLVIGSKYGVVHFYENVKIDGGSGEETPGTDTFIERENEENPFSEIQLPEPYYEYNWNRANIRLADLDHDGDLDAFVGASSVDRSGDGDYTTPAIYYFENKGTSTNPQFGTYSILNNPFAGLEIPDNPIISFGDMDMDGDQDLIVGGNSGEFSYYVNVNPPPTLASPQPFAFQVGSGPQVIDPTLTLSDTDSDLITQVTFTLTDFEPGKDILGFTPQFGITGSFDNTNGTLILKGRNTVSQFQTVLRSVTYNYVGTIPGQRTSSPIERSITLPKNLTLIAVDTDGTRSSSVQKSFNVGHVNVVPVLTGTGSALTVNANTATVIDNTIAITDGDDPVLTGATVSISSGFTSGDALIFNTQNGITGSFNGATGTLTLTGSSSVANYQTALRSVQYSSTGAGAFSKTISFTVTDGENPSNVLPVSINLIGEISVYNGISPNGDGDNDYFLIENIQFLEPANAVTIFNRWGDKVFETQNYNNGTNRFDGIGDNGKEVTSGIYFYKVSFPSGRKPLSGYLTIKR